MGSDFTTVSIIGNVIFGISTCLLGWTTLRFKNKADLRSQRFSVYKETLDELDGLNRKFSSIFSDLYASDMANLLRNMLTTPDKLMDHILSMNSLINKRLADANELINLMFSRLNSIRLVASKETLQLLDILRNSSSNVLVAQQEYINSINLPKTIGELKDKNHEVFDRSTLENLTKAQAIYAETYKKLEIQMRKDVGY